MAKECVGRSLRLKASALLASLATPFLTQQALADKANVEAVQINTQNAAELIQQGPDAIGGIGDWFISNGTLCAIISDVEHENEFSTKGGTLVDLGFCDRPDDHYTSAQDLIDGQRSRPLDAVSIKAVKTASVASLIVKSATPGATQVATYSLSKAEPTQLKISKSIVKTEEPNADFNIYSALNFNYHSLEPFVFNSQDISQTNGFKNEDFVSRGLSAISAAGRNADTIITISPPTATAPISYGWQLKSARRVEGDDSYELPRFVLADDESNIMLVLTDTFYLGDGSSIGWLQIPQIPLLSLTQKSSLELEEIIFVGKGGDVASITDQMLTNTQIVSGQVADPNVGLHIDQSDGSPLTHVRPLADGRFTLRLAAGEYQLRQLGSAKRRAIQAFKVDKTETDVSTLTPKPLPEAAELTLPGGEAMRLVFVGLDGTDNPNFTDTYTGSSVIEDDGEHFQKEVSQIFLAGVAGDPQTVTLAPGRYRIYAVRGPEYSLEKTDLTLAAGDEKALNIKAPSHLIQTPNHIASDLHVHAGQSFDNAFSDTERVRTFVAEHGEVMVSSEHDKPVDFAPLISAMGVENMITSIAAAEVTSLLPTKLNPYTGGHANFFPYLPEAHTYRRGMINHENKRLRDIIHAVRHKHPNTVVQLNHPRLNTQLSGKVLPNDYHELINHGNFLEHMGSAGHPYNPHKALTSEPNNVLIEKHPETGVRDIDFDLIELINPGGEHHQSRINAVRQDWLSFLKQGEKIVATANSDSHTSHAQVAVPRTMVAMANDSVRQFDQAAFLRSLKAGNAYGTTGPMLEVSLSGKAMGETFTGQRGQLSVQITSVDWIPVDKAIVQINGETIAQYDLADQTINTLLIPISFETDSFVTVEVSGPASEDYAAVYPEITPYAFSNPIYVDFDGDGQWMPPGLQTTSEKVYTRD